MAVEGGTVSVLRGDVSGVDAERVMDATGRVACPGFMDLHAHSALMVLALRSVRLGLQVCEARPARKAQPGLLRTSRRW